MTLATLHAAETAASFAAVAQTEAPASGEAAEVDPWVTMEMEMSAIPFLPEGWKLNQLRAEHPNEQFAAFRRGILTEIARCLDVPYNVAAGDSSDYNYASGRLDHQTYLRSLDVQRAELQAIWLDRLFAHWWREAVRTADYGLYAQIERIFVPHAWLWPEKEEIDPRWVRARAEVVKQGLGTEADYHARNGRDWAEQIDQRGREAKARQAAGLPQPWERGRSAGGGAEAAGVDDLADAIAERLLEARR